MTSGCRLSSSRPLPSVPLEKRCDCGRQALGGGLAQQGGRRRQPLTPAGRRRRRCRQGCNAGMQQGCESGRCGGQPMQQGCESGGCGERRLRWAAAVGARCFQRPGARPIATQQAAAAGPEQRAQRQSVHLRSHAASASNRSQRRRKTASSPHVTACTCTGASAILWGAGHSKGEGFEVGSSGAGPEASRLASTSVSALTERVAQSHIGKSSGVLRSALQAGRQRSALRAGAAAGD